MGERTIVSSFSTSPRLSVFGIKTGIHLGIDACEVFPLTPIFLSQRYKIFSIQQHLPNLLIWKVHHLTTSSNFSFVQVEAPAGMDSISSRNGRMAFAILPASTNKYRNSRKKEKCSRRWKSWSGWMMSCSRRVYAYQTWPVVKNSFLTYVAALRLQGMWGG